MKAPHGGSLPVRPGAYLIPHIADLGVISAGEWATAVPLPGARLEPPVAQLDPQAETIAVRLSPGVAWCGHDGCDWSVDGGSEVEKIRAFLKHASGQHQGGTP